MYSTAGKVTSGSMQIRQLRLIVWIAGALLAGAYAVLFLPGAWFRFDDFWQLNGTAVNVLPLGDLLTQPNAADGRWNPGMRLVLRAIGALSGIERAWPFYLALLAGHALNVFLTVRLARALGGPPRTQAITAFVAIAGLNFSLFTLVTIALLYSVICTAWMLAAMLAALRYVRGGRWWHAALCGTCTLIALCLREIAVVTPLLCALLLALYGGAGTRVDRRRWTGLALAFATAAAGLLILAIVAGISLLPEAGRYRLSVGWHSARHLAVLAGHAAIWLAIPLMAGGVRTLRMARREIVLAAGWAVLSVLPTLLLTWQSPGHLYVALFGTALAAGRLWASLGERSRITALALPVVAALVLAVAATFAARRDILRWGPINRQVLADWQMLRRPGDARVVIFDSDNGVRNRGLARLIGPGIRLRDALRLVSREPIEAATICIDLIEGPPYAPEPGDALFEHRDGRLRRVTAPPFKAYCLPSDPAVAPRD